MINLTPGIENSAKGYETLLLINTVNEFCSKCPASALGICAGAPRSVAYAAGNEGVCFLFEMDGGEVHFAYFTDGNIFMGPGPEEGFGFVRDGDGWKFAPGKMADEVYEAFYGEAPSKN